MEESPGGTAELFDVWRTLCSRESGAFSEVLGEGGHVSEGVACFAALGKLASVDWNWVWE